MHLYFHFKLHFTVNQPFGRIPPKVHLGHDMADCRRPHPHKVDIFSDSFGEHKQALGVCYVGVWSPIPQLSRRIRSRGYSACRISCRISCQLPVHFAYHNICFRVLKKACLHFFNDVEVYIRMCSRTARCTFTGILFTGS